MVYISSKIIRFNQSLEFTGKLPASIRVMNPFKNNPGIMETCRRFYEKFYNDTRKRTFIIGINPGRHGAGVTGIPFTDTKRLKENCSLEIEGLHTHEPSSVFIYKMIEAYGGVKKFYSKFYINSLCPLGFIQVRNGKAVNHNYYDSKQLLESSKEFIVATLRRQIQIGMNTDVCYCLGTGKNYFHLLKLNDEFGFFDKIIPLEHPRFIVQYKSRDIEHYIKIYLDKLSDSN